MHKYLGLLLILFLSWMSLSGILMNHPGLIGNFSVPAWLVPQQYHIQNWNRSALIDLVYAKKDPQRVFAAGKQGIWQSRDGGKSFGKMQEGLSGSRYYDKTKDLFLWEGESDLLFAATDGGLYVNSLQGAPWRPVTLGREREPVRKILQTGDRLVVLAASNAYASPLPPADPQFTQLALHREESRRDVSLIELFFDLHNGDAWGFFGLLLFDATGLIVVFLCISAFYTWYFPWKRRRHKKDSKLLTNRASRRAFKLLFKYHLKIGIWISVILLIIAGTGLFMRPPFLVALVNGSIPAAFYPGFLSENPWHDRIQNALYDTETGQVVIQATDGFWVGPADFSEPFRKHTFDVPVFVMGTTVFESEKRGYLVGSFSGIFHWLRDESVAIDLLSGHPVTNISTLRPAWNMVTGYFATPDEEAFITTHLQGLMPVGEAKSNGRIDMPQALRDDFRMPLWNYLFEIHNGRFFADWVGEWHILIIPLGSLLFILITLTGIYDWIFLRLWRSRN